MQKIYWHMEEDKLIDLIKSLLVAPTMWIRSTEDSILRLTTDAEAGEVQEEIYRWLKERIEEDKI